MNVYQLTQADRDPLLAGADLEAVLADREREELERDDRTQVRLSGGPFARRGHEGPKSSKNRYAAARSISA